MEAKKFTIIGMLLLTSILLISLPEQASCHILELFIRTISGPTSLTFKITSISPRVWKAHSSFAEEAYLTSETMYVDPLDLTMPGTYSGNDFGWDTDGFPCIDPLKPALGRGVYEITVQALNGTDTLIVSNYGTRFLGPVVIYYDYIGNLGKGTFCFNGVAVDTINMYDNPEGLQPTKPQNFICNNTNEDSTCPNLKWNHPLEPKGIEFNYKIYRKMGQGEFEIISSGLSNSHWADTSFSVGNGQGSFTYSVVAYTDRSPDSEFSNYVFVERTELISNILSKRLIRKPGMYNSFAYPNPFNSKTRIAFKLLETSYVNIIIYSIVGQQIRNLISNYYETGSHSVSWDGKNDGGMDVASGIYIYQIQASNFYSTKQICLIK